MKAVSPEFKTFWQSFQPGYFYRSKGVCTAGFFLPNCQKYSFLKSFRAVDQSMGPLSIQKYIYDQTENQSSAITLIMTVVMNPYYMYLLSISLGLSNIGFLFLVL